MPAPKARSNFTGTFFFLGKSLQKAPRLKRQSPFLCVEF